MNGEFLHRDKLNHAESKFHAEVVVPSGKVWDSTSPRSSSLIAHDGAEVGIGSRFRTHKHKLYLWYCSILNPLVMTNRLLLNMAQLKVCELSPQ